MGTITFYSLTNVCLLIHLWNANIKIVFVFCIPTAAEPVIERWKDYSSLLLAENKQVDERVSTFKNLYFHIPVVGSKSADNDRKSAIHQSFVQTDLKKGRRNEKRRTRTNERDEVTFSKLWTRLQQTMRSSTKT